nr:ribonuclease H-like domain-containing protein [Tanacetum cinerariifolium]
MPLTDYLTLYDVLVMPKYCVSLMSVHKVARDSKLVIAFNEMYFYVMNQDLRKGKIMRTGKKLMDYITLMEIKVIYSKDVKFFKDIFPFKQNSSTRIDKSVQDVNHLNFFNFNTLDDLSELPNDEKRRNPSPIRHGNSPSHSGSTSAFSNENDAGHSQDADASASENESFATDEDKNNSFEGIDIHDQTQDNTKPLDEDDDIVVLENSETKEEDVKEDESNRNKERYTFEDDDDDEEFDNLD